MAKAGRPKLDDPKKNLVGLKLSSEEVNRLKAYALRNNMTVTEVLKKGIEIQYESEENSETK